MLDTATIQAINAWATVVSALATVILVVITGYYAFQTRKLVRIEAARSEFEATRVELESRPYLEVRILDWGANNCEPAFDVINVGTGPAVRVRFDNPDDLVWHVTAAALQGFTTIAAALPPPRFGFRRAFAAPPTSTEFRIRYNDAAGLHEFADKWRLGVETGLVRVNATILKTKPLESEDYVVEQGPQ